MAIVVIGDNTGDDYSGTMDTQIDNNNPSTNNGSGTNSAVSYISSAFRHSLLLEFTGLSSLSSGYTIDDASIFLYREDGTSPSFDISIRQLLRNWSESESTWVRWSTGNNWTIEGALSDNNDVSSSDTVVLSVNSTNGYKEFTSAALVDLVADWYDGSASNRGVKAYRNVTSGGDWEYHVFTTSEGTDGHRPYLSITHTESSGNAYYYQQMQM